MIKKLIVPVSVIITFLCLSYGKYVSIALIPLIFGLTFSIIYDHRIIYGPGTVILFTISIIRYYVYPILVSITNVISFLNDNNYWISYFMYVFELFIILFFWKFFAIRNYPKKKPPLTKKLHNYHIITIIFIILSVYFISNSPELISRFNFIINSNNELIQSDLSESLLGGIRIVEYTRLLLIISIFTISYNSYRRTNSKIALITLFTSTLLLSCVYSDSSRMSLFIPMIVLIFSCNRFLIEYKRKTTIILTAITIISLTTLSALKFYNAKSTSFEIIFNDMNIIYLDQYFGGLNGIYTGIESKDYISERTTTSTFISDTFSYLPIIGSNFDKKNRTTSYYNDYINSNSAIIPTMIQGIVYFGYLFSGLFSILIIFCVTQFDKLFNSTNNFAACYIFATVSAKSAFVIPGNYTLFCNVIAYMIVGLYFIIFIYDKLYKLFFKHETSNY